MNLLQPKLNFGSQLIKIYSKEGRDIINILKVNYTDSHITKLNPVNSLIDETVSCEKSLKNQLIRTTTDGSDFLHLFYFGLI